MDQCASSEKTFPTLSNLCEYGIASLYILARKDKTGLEMFFRVKRNILLRQKRKLHIKKVLSDWAVDNLRCLWHSINFWNVNGAMTFSQMTLNQKHFAKYHSADLLFI